MESVRFNLCICYPVLYTKISSSVQEICQGLPSFPACMPLHAGPAGIRHHEGLSGCSLPHLILAAHLIDNQYVLVANKTFFCILGCVPPGHSDCTCHRGLSSLAGLALLQ